MEDDNNVTLLKKVEKQGSMSGRPNTTVTISDCGEFHGRGMYRV
jgi:hypothetical protein